MDSHSDVASLAERRAQLKWSALDLKAVELVPPLGGRLAEGPAPTTLASQM